MSKKVTKTDCVCEKVPKPDGGIRLIYNVFCPFHKEADRGYGYDIRGRANNRYSERVGTIGATLVVAGCLAGITALVVLAFLKW